MEATETPEMFSLDFSDRMMQQRPDESGVAQSPGAASDAAGLEAIAAALQLFDLCSPAEDSTISADDLSRVLRSHLGGQAEADRILGLVTQDSHSADRFNFLNYWQGMDRFFQEAGGLASSACSSPGAGEQVGTIRGMQRFRDGVLIMARSGSGMMDEATASISSLHLLNLLNEIRTVASDPIYWDEVIQAVPAEEGFGLTLPEVAEAVYIWLKDFLKSELDATAVASDSAELPWTDTAEAPLSPDDADPTTSGGIMSHQMSMIGRQMSLHSQATCSGGRRSESIQQRSNMLEGLEPAMSREMRRAQEIQDLILDRTPQENIIVHQALSQLNVVHNSICSSVLRQQQEVESLQREVASISEKKADMDDQLARTQHYASELDTKFAAIQQKGEESGRKVAGLEEQVQALSAQNEELQWALSKTQAHDEDLAKELEKDEKKISMIDGRMAQLLDQADSAEGRAEWMLQKLEHTKKRLAVAAQASRSYASCAEEGDEVSSLLQQQLLEGNAAAKKDNSDSAAEKLQHVQLQRLRQVRDDLLKAHESWATRSPNESSSSPRELQVHRRCTFLAAQLQALLRHTTDLESLIDKAPATGDTEEKRLSLRGKTPGTVDIEEKRLTSVKRFAEESQKSFDEFSDQLHTLEVQKADVDQELRRLQQRFAEQKGQLREVQRHRDQLLVEAGNGHSEAGVKTTENSDAVSTSSVSTLAASGGFLFDGARPSSGNLQSSPKKPKFQTKVKAVMQMSRPSHVAPPEALLQGGGVDRSRPNPLIFDMGNRRASALRASALRIDPVEQPKKRSTSRGADKDRRRSDERQSVDKNARREQKDKKTTKSKGGQTGNCETQ